jgi:hypothetical protein
MRSITARSSCSPPAVGVTSIFVGTARSTSKCVCSGVRNQLLAERFDDGLESLGVEHVEQHQNAILIRVQRPVSGFIAFTPDMMPLLKHLAELIKILQADNIPVGDCA